MLLTQILTTTRQENTSTLLHRDEDSAFPRNDGSQVDSDYSSDSESSTSDRDSVDEIDYHKLSRDIILQYFDKTGVHHRFGSRKARPDVEKKTREVIASWNLPLSDRVLEKYTVTGLDIAATAYRHVIPRDVQVCIALNTFCTALFDDGRVGKDAMLAFAPRFHGGVAQLHPVLDLFVQNLRDMNDMFTAYGANAMISSCMEFANAEMFLREAKDLRLTPESFQYIEFIRLKEGFGEAYAIFIWPRSMCPDTKAYIQAIPDTCNFINLINDLFSYYKEAKHGETGTYLHCYGTVHNMTVPEVLQNLVEQTIAVVKRIRILLGEGIERDCWEEFAAGYTQFHLHTDRYELVDILPEYF